MWFKKKNIENKTPELGFNAAAFSGLEKVSTPQEPVTLAKLRLEAGADDVGANRGRVLYDEHKTKVNNQWINPLQSVNSGYGNAQFSIYNYQNVNYFECYALAQDPMMNKIFNVLSETPFANGGEVVSELSEEELKTLDVANKKYNVHKLLVDAVRSNYVTGGCLIFMDFGDENLEEPLDLKNKDMRTFKGFRHIDPINVVAIDVNSSEPAKADYMKPNKWYVVGLGSVHHSRFLKFEENVPELMMRPMTMYFGMPLTLLIKQDVANSNLASQGLANLLNRFRYLYLKTEENNFIGSGAVNLRQRLEAMSMVQDNFGIYPLKSTEDMTQLTTSLAGMAENCEFFFQILAAKTDITMSILLGKGAQGLSGTLEGERKNFYDRIRTIQESVKKNILTIEGIIYGAETDGVYKEFADYVFNPLEQETEREKSENLRSYVEVTKSLVELGVSADKALEWLKGFKDFRLDKVEVDLETPGLVDYDGGESYPFIETENSEFKDSEHPRDKGGKFTSSSREAGQKKKENGETAEILGEEFSGLKGQEAIDKLMKEKRGYVPDAFSRNDIGGISLIWGNDDMGLSHIIKRRKDTKQPLGKLLSSVSEVIEKGNLEKAEKGRFKITHKGKIAIIEPKLNGDELQFLFTAYYD